MEPGPEMRRQNLSLLTLLTTLLRKLLDVGNELVVGRALPLAALGLEPDSESVDTRESCADANDASDSESDDAK
jgi:hypothetical protein